MTRRQSREIARFQTTSLGRRGEVRGGGERLIKDDDKAGRTMNTDSGDDWTPAPVAEQNWLFCHPPQQHATDQWLPKGRGNIPRRKIPRVNSHCCNDNVTK